MTINLLQSVQHPFLELAPDLASEPLVYLDAGSAELAQTSLGAHFLFGLGAANVCDVASASPNDALLPSLCGKRVTTLVIAITQLLSDAHPLILGAVLAHPQACHVLVLSSVTEHAHACQEGPSGELGPEAFKEYGSMLQQDVMDMQAALAAASHLQPQPLVVEVRALPLRMCALDSTSFVLPAQGAAASQARVGGTAAGLACPQSAAHAAGRGSAGGGGDDDDDEGGGSPEDGGSSGGLSLLAHELVGIAAQLGMQLETFSVGVVAHQLALEVSSLPPPSHLPMELPGRPTPTLGLVLVDRSLDLVTPSLHQDNLWEMIAGLLPRDGDVASTSQSGGPSSKQSKGLPAWRPLTTRVLLPEVAPSQCIHPTLPSHQHQEHQHQHQHQEQQPPLSYGAELLCPSDKQAAARLEQVAAKKGKDAAVLVRKWMKQALSAERLQPSMRSRAGAVPAAELQALAEDLCRVPDAGLRHHSLAALGMACAQAMSGEGCARWEAAASLERQMLQMLVGEAGEMGSTAVWQVLMDALHTAQAGKGLLHVSDIVQLLPFVYSLTPDAQRVRGQEEGGGTSIPEGPFSKNEEADLRWALLQALQQATYQYHHHHHHHHQQQQQQQPHHQSGLQDPNRSSVSVLHELLPDCEGGADLEARLDALFERLHWAAQARGQLHELRHVTVTDMFADNAGSAMPLVRQLVRLLARGDPVKDVVQASSGSLTGLLSKGLGRFGLNAGLFGAVAGAVAPRVVRLSECTAVLVFMVGGISPAEIREARQELEERPSVYMPPLLLGGTSFVSPADIARQLLRQQR